jgi:hypothetical protein
MPKGSWVSKTYRSLDFIEEIGKWLLQDGSNLGASWQSITSLSTSATYSRARVKRLTGNDFILLYANASNYPVARIIQVDFNAGTYTAGTAVQIVAAAEQIIGCLLISSTSFLVQTTAKIYACSVSGTTVTAGTGVALAATGSNGCVIQGNTTKTTFVELYRDTTNLVGKMYTVSGTTISAGSSANIKTGLTSLTTPTVGATVADGKGVCCYVTGASGVTLIATLFTFNEDGSGSPASSGSTQTVGSASGQNVLTGTGVSAYKWNCLNLLVATHESTGDKYVIGMHACNSAAPTSVRWYWVKFDVSGGTISSDNNDDTRNGVWSDDVESLRNIGLQQIDQRFAMGMGLKYGATERIEANFYYMEVLTEGYPIFIRQIMGLFRDETEVTSGVVEDASSDINSTGNGALMAFSDSANGKVFYRLMKHPTAIA